MVDGEAGVSSNIADGCRFQHKEREVGSRGRGLARTGQVTRRPRGNADLLGDFHYDALGRRAEKVDQAGETDVTARRYLDGWPAVEERDGDDALQATDVNGESPEAAREFPSRSIAHLSGKGAGSPHSAGLRLRRVFFGREQESAKGPRPSSV